MDKMSKSGQDVTIAIVITVIVFLGSAAAFHQYFYTTKLAEIDSLKAQRTSKEQTFNNYKKVIEEKPNYEKQLVALHATWDNNKHYFVNGMVDWDDIEEIRQTQFTIFQLYEKVIEAAVFAGIEVEHPVEQEFTIIITEELHFHPDDEPFDFPPHFLFLINNWSFVPAERFPDADSEKGAADVGGSSSGSTGGFGFGTGGGSSSSAGGAVKNLFNAHDFTVEFEATYDQLKKFIEIMQDLEGDEAWVISVHCFETTGMLRFRWKCSAPLMSFMSLAQPTFHPICPETQAAARQAAAAVVAAAAVEAELAAVAVALDSANLYFRQHLNGLFG
jgi:uncharacterized membrane protein YgcG